jgi:ankyrin repeat protein
MFNMITNWQKHQENIMNAKTSLLAYVCVIGMITNSVSLAAVCPKFRSLSEAAQYLQANKLTVNATCDDNNNTLLMQTNDPDIIDLLLTQGANINARNKEGLTAIVKAAMRGDIKIVEYLYQKGASLKELDNKGNNIIINVLKTKPQNALTLIEWLVKNGAIINAQNNNGLTALMVASHQGNLPIVKLLASNGASQDLKAKNGLTAIQFAQNVGNEEVVNYLKRLKTDESFQRML